MAKDRQKLLKALREAGATPVQTRMAKILLAVNGLDSALGFVDWIKANGPTNTPDVKPEPSVWPFLRPV